MSKNNRTIRITVIIISIIIVIVAIVGVKEYMEFMSDFKLYIHSMQKLNESYVLKNDINVYSEEYENIARIEEKYERGIFNSAFERIKKENTEIMKEIEKKCQEENRTQNVNVEKNEIRSEREEYIRKEIERSESERRERERIEQERIEKERSERERMEIERIERERAERERLRPEGISKYGSLNIVTDPTDVSIYLDGKLQGQSPRVISQVALGKHILSLKKKGCAPIYKEIIIENYEMLNISEKLSIGIDIKINTGIRNDSIYVDGVYVGTSPLTTFVTYGHHEIMAKRNTNIVKEEIILEYNDVSKNISLSFYNSENRHIMVNNVVFTMVAVDGGTFTMGNQMSTSKVDEVPCHDVTLSSFYIGETEVTQELWETVMGDNPSRFKGHNRPVERVSWEDCQMFVTRLNQITGETFRLPTEAEWEYAARGGNRSNNYKYSGSYMLEDVSWYDDNSSKKTHNVKTKKPNELGIYDMSGNVGEWCHDWYGYYDNVHRTDPMGPSNGLGRVIRGGSWYSYGEYSRVLHRYYLNPLGRNSYYGFRIVMVP